ncbi:MULTISPECIES: dynamin family protein [unclassified Rhodococcus (in: high G+C Gram-positive bacteria)]|uniref:dynamin family protein n=1 Tax=unclassified Rhodococcus (in: high G+C Gram-positive bacteria) TaxID=192944 RepID=UPI00163ACF05|nr:MULTISPECIES: dynamin family protein [unclassified Rhodococcus (in: high G+C Gram-positive bacteria)]MBC2642746.1 Isoniazid-inducible protein iniA [Rhodococcus sp. 3A]MBC2892512.1 Isoniazid-inducible protein iniA [Rhodococcus sp. 4CII]
MNATLESSAVSTPVRPNLPAETTASMTALLSQLAALTRAAGRGDLLTRLSHTESRLADPRTRVVVLGLTDKGVSSVTGALVDSEMSAAARSRHEPVVVEYGPVAEDPDSTVTLPHDLLAEGLVLVDAPGFSGHAPARAADTLALVPTADAVLFVSDASQEYTEPEIALLTQVQKLCPVVICIVNKIDFYPRWADIQKANRTHLQNADLPLPLLPVSALMHQDAREAGDDALDVESGIPQLVDYLRTEVIAKADVVLRNSVIADVRTVTDHLSLSLSAELDAVRDPQRGAALLAQMAQARAVADQLRQRSANWQHTLADGAIELMTDIEHDLRHRLRTVMRAAEQDIGSSDPAPRWEEFGGWLDGEIATCVRENFVMAHTRSLDLARSVGDRFAEDGKVPVPALRIDNVDHVLEPVNTLESLESSQGFTQRVLSSMRGSYGGVLMVGLVTSLAGLALVNPFSIGAGVLLGANTYREDRKARTARRQAEAKVAVSRLMDDVIFQVGKESKQRLREVQRVLRDHFTDLANEMLRSVDDSLRAATDASKMHDDHRATRSAQIRTELDALRQIRLQAAGFVGQGAA